MIAKYANVPMLRFSLIFSMSFSTKFDTKDLHQSLTPNHRFNT